MKKLIYPIQKIILVLFIFTAGCATAEPLQDRDRSTDNSDFKPLSAEKLWEMKRIGSPVISPNGDWVVAPVTRYTMDDDQSHTDLWLFSTDGRVERPLNPARIGRWPASV
jgi:hypothetical protein